MDSYFGFLAEIGKVITVPMAPRQALPLIARIAVPRLGDLCSVHLLDGYGNVEVSYVAWAEPGSGSTQALQERTFAGPEGEAAARTLMDDLGMASCLAHPLKRRGGVMGCLFLGTFVPGGFSPDQEFLVEEFARNVAYGLEARILPETASWPNEDGRLPMPAAEEDASARDLLRLVVEGAGDPILIVDAEGRCLLSNEAAMQCFGWGSGKVADLHPLTSLLERWRLLDAEGRPLGPEDLPAVRALSGRGACRRVVRAVHRETQEERWWEMRAVPKPDREGKAVLAVLQFRDVTPIRSLKASLRQERQSGRATRDLLQSILDALPDRLAVFDSQGRILYANKGMSDFLGPELLQKGFTESLLEFPDHLALSEENGDPLAWDQLPLRKALRGESAADKVIRYRSAAKAEEGWTRMHAVPILDLQGRVVMTVVLLHDLTGFKRDQENREAVEARLRNAHKMDAVGRLAGGIAHDFNNLLTSIIGYADLIADAAGSHPLIPGYAGEIRVSAERAARLTAQLLAFGRRQMLHPRTVDLNARLASQLPLLQELAGPGVEIGFQPAADLPMVRVDPAKWDQAVLNLVINSGEAMPKGGRMVFATSFRRLDRELELEEAALPPGGYAVIEISDTGQGLDAETRAHIFEPFFLTGMNPARSGGLGLPMVLGFIRQSGGFIDLQSSLGQGTLFRIYLPAWEERPPGPECLPPGTGQDLTP